MFCYVHNTNQQDSQCSVVSVSNCIPQDEEINKSLQQSRSQSQNSGHSLRSSLLNTMQEKEKKDHNQRPNQDHPICSLVIQDSVEEVSHKLDHVKMDPPPSHVILYVGTNNLPNNSAEVTAKKLSSWKKKLKANSRWLN